MNRKQRVLRPAKGAQVDTVMLCLDIPYKSNVLGWVATERVLPVVM